PEITRNSVQRATNSRPVHLAYSTLPALSASPEAQVVDAYLDYQLNTVSADDLIGIGFTTSDDTQIECIREGMVHVVGYFEIDTPPTTPDNALIYSPGIGTLNHRWATGTVESEVTVSRDIYFVVGDYLEFFI